MTVERCRACGASAPTLQRYACARCGFATAEAERISSEHARLSCMRMMSFALTERQLLDGSKTVTRRTGWANLRPGERLLAVRKAMGLKAGERVQPLCEIEVMSVRRQALGCIDAADCAAEGFPHLSPEDFIRFFMAKVKTPGIGRSINEITVTRIEFRKIPGTEHVPSQIALV